MDESFSPSNLRRIWDAQTRKGKDLLGFFPEVKVAYEVLRQARKVAHALRKSTKPLTASELSSLDVVSDFKAAADRTLSSALAETSEALIAQVDSNAFDWGLHTTMEKFGRQLFSVGDNASAYFADKQLQRILADLLPMRLSSRHSIVAALVRTLGNDLPKVIVRLDVREFYASVDHAILLGRLERAGLSPTSLRLIRQLLVQMRAITGRAKGLPTGVGLCAKLAEFYMRELDAQLRDSPGVLYYARYVDDIVLVHGETERGSLSANGIVSWIGDELSKLELTLNLTKQAVRPLSAQKKIDAFEFLGYVISYDAKKPCVRITDARIAVLKNRIDRTFEVWDRADPSNHGRRRLLLDRLRFLAGNTRLSHNKRDAMVGIYFSNPNVSDASFFEELDIYLAERISKSSIPTDVLKKINEVSFVDAFQARTVRKFTVKRMVQLRGAWRG